ncbi:MAG: hypothetical protein D6768_09065 [Chloroflexi bacterium]|nr:MAG: hypothetical protein D6768_09065 [Chloroflexota bacterium]
MQTPEFRIQAWLIFADFQRYKFTGLRTRLKRETQSIMCASGQNPYVLRFTFSEDSRQNQQICKVNGAG